MGEFFSHHSETKPYWDELELKWLCIYCDSPVKIKYIATGHDHTDYSYQMCNCLGARTNGKPNERCD